MIRLTIDGKQIETKEGNTILQAAREDGRLAEISIRYFGLDLTQPD